MKTIATLLVCAFACYAQTIITPTPGEPLKITSGGAGAPSAASLVRVCSAGVGLLGTGGGAALTAGSTYIVQGACLNSFGATFTITAIKCYVDGGASTGNVTNNSGTGLLTGAITGTTSWASGTLSATTTIADGGWMNFTFTGDGVTKQITCNVIGTL